MLCFRLAFTAHGINPEAEGTGGGTATSRARERGFCQGAHTCAHFPVSPPRRPHSPTDAPTRGAAWAGRGSTRVGGCWPPVAPRRRPRDPSGRWPGDDDGCSVHLIIFSQVRALFFFLIDWSFTPRSTDAGFFPAKETGLVGKDVHAIVWLIGMPSRPKTRSAWQGYARHVPVLLQLGPPSGRERVGSTRSWHWRGVRPKIRRHGAAGVKGYRVAAAAAPCCYVTPDVNVASEIRAPCLSLVSCSTRSWLARETRFYYRTGSRPDRARAGQLFFFKTKSLNWNLVKIARRL
jgi:hypothetical protein